MALFGVSGVFMSSGLGGPAVSLVLLSISVGIALLVVIIDGSRGHIGRNIVGVVLFCALGFAVGWGPSQYAQGARMPATVLGGRTR